MIIDCIYIDFVENNVCDSKFFFVFWVVDEIFIYINDMVFISEMYL